MRAAFLKAAVLGRFLITDALELMERGALAAALLACCFLLCVGSAAGRAPLPESIREQAAVAKIAARGLPLYCGGGLTREVALTFDDGPTVSTPRLVAGLRRTGSPATFFLIGQSAARYRSYAQAEMDLGAVGAHSQHHMTLTRLGPAAARREIDEGTRSVERAIGARVRLFRPPGGHRTPAIDQIVASRGLLTVLWAVDPRDWARASSNSVVAALASDPRLLGGAIVVLHEFKLSTLDAVPALVHMLRQRGLRPVTVQRLLADDPPTLAQQRADARAGSCVHLYTP